MHAVRTPRAGFLLTETLATFTLSAFVLLGLVSTASVLLRAVDRSVAHVQDVDDLSRTLAAIARDLSSLSRARFDGVEPQPFVFRGGPNSLFFARRERGTDGGMETHVIALREIVVGDGTQLVRADALLPARATSFAALHFGPQRDLVTGPARLRFAYVASAGGAPGPEKGERVESVSRNWTPGLRLPAAIVVEAIEATSGRVIVTTRVPIHADADIGCLSNDGGQGSAPAATPGIPAPGIPAPSVPIPPVVTSAPLSPDPAKMSGDFCALRLEADATPPVPR